MCVNLKQVLDTFTKDVPDGTLPFTTFICAKVERDCKNIEYCKIEGLSKNAISFFSFFFAILKVQLPQFNPSTVISPENIHIEHCNRASIIWNLNLISDHLDAEFSV